MDRTEELIEKIKLEATEIKNEMGLNEETLTLLRHRLRISPIPLEECKSGSFSQDVCYPQMLNGLKTMHSLLKSAHLYTEADLTDLQYDLQEFISNMEEVLTEKSIPIPTHVSRKLPDGISEFQEKAGIFLILHDLCDAFSVFQKGFAAHV
ncbi:uncharacterized protein ACNLHF_019921 [Anomaloglossus baeobatrachus]